MEQKKIFNLESKEQYNMARVIGGNPNGIINFNQSNHQTARQIYRNMMDRTWFNFSI